MRGEERRERLAYGIAANPVRFIIDFFATWPRKSESSAKIFEGGRVFAFRGHDVKTELLALKEH